MQLIFYPSGYQGATDGFCSFGAQETQIHFPFADPRGFRRAGRCGEEPFRVKSGETSVHRPTNEWFWRLKKGDLSGDVATGKKRGSLPNRKAQICNML